MKYEIGDKKNNEVFTKIVNPWSNCCYDEFIIYHETWQEGDVLEMLLEFAVDHDEGIGDDMRRFTLTREEIDELLDEFGGEVPDYYGNGLDYLNFVIMRDSVRWSTPNDKMEE